MFMVYWTEVKDNEKTPHQKEFGSTDIVGSLGFMEQLRTKQRAGEAICFITFQSENPDSVGHPGVADPSPDYNWTKRRR